MADYNFDTDSGPAALSVGPAARPAIAQPYFSNGLFGWLHADTENGDAGIAVLICGALSHEELDSHHSLRVLADAFAKAGYPAMRFDYTGTGDSGDLSQMADPSGELWSVWQRNVHDAADQLRRRTGAKRLILCGLRIGATLAALAAERRDDVAGLILLAPVLRGRSYIRQLQIESGLAHGKTVTKGGGLEYHELSLSPETVHLIGEADLRGINVAPGLKIAIFSQTLTGLLTETKSNWTAQGAVIDSFSFDGLEPLLCTDTQGYKEPAAAAPMIDWMRHAIPLQQLHSAAMDLNADWGGMTLPGCVETPLRFGPKRRLFGILSRPEHGLGKTAVLIVNTGRSPHAGVGRFGVEFARRLAASGITTLRFDFAGLGDSTGIDGEENMRSDVFEDERTADISAAIDMLEELGCQRFVVQGVCSGAYHALHGAVAETRIDAVLMANLPLFLWQAGDSIAEAKKRSYGFSHYRMRLVDAALWRRMLRGESDIIGTIKSQIWRLAKALHLPGTPRGQNPAAFARKLMAGLSRRHVRTFFLFDPDHAGAHEIQNLFGKDGAGLKSFAGARIDMVPGLGEAVGESAARREAADRMIDFIGAF